LQSVPSHYRNHPEELAGKEMKALGRSHQKEATQSRQKGAPLTGERGTKGGRKGNVGFSGKFTS